MSLRKIGGQYIATARQTLPNAETSTEDFQENKIKLPVFGMVRFKCQRMTGRDFFLMAIHHSIMTTCHIWRTTNPRLHSGAALK